jgi:site-specific recombinase XerD
MNLILNNGIAGHKHIEATMIYTHVLNQGGKGIRSPADAL